MNVKITFPGLLDIQNTAYLEFDQVISAVDQIDASFLVRGILDVQ
jgi:hypothetical protein